MNSAHLQDNFVGLFLLTCDFSPQLAVQYTRSQLMGILGSKEATSRGAWEYCFTGLLREKNFAFQISDGRLDKMFFLDVSDLCKVYIQCVVSHHVHLGHGKNGVGHAMGPSKIQINSIQHHK